MNINHTGDDPGGASNDNIGSSVDERLPIRTEGKYYDAIPAMVIKQTGVDVYESMTLEPELESDESRWSQEIRSNHYSLPWHKRPSIYLLSGLVAVLTLCDMMIQPPIISLRMQKICEALNLNSSDNQQCSKSEVQKILSLVTSFSLIISGFICVIFTSKLNFLSDKIGRILIFKYIGIVKITSILLHIYSVAPSTKLSIWFFLLPNIVDAFSGSTFTLLAMANSYITDIIDPESTTTNISFLMSILFGTVGVAPLLSSFIVSYSNGNNFNALYAGLFMCIIYNIMCHILLVETRHPNAMEKTKLSHQRMHSKFTNHSNVNSQDSNRSLVRRFKYVLSSITYQIYLIFCPLRNLWASKGKNNSKKPRITLLLLLVIEELLIISTSAVLSPIILLTTYIFDWTSVEIGYLISLIGITRSMVLLLIAPTIIHFLKRHHKANNSEIDKIDIASIRYPILFANMSNLLMFLYPSKITSIILYTILQALSGIASPTLSGTMIKYCPKDKTGESFGAISLVNSIVILIASPSFLRFYGLTVNDVPQLFLIIPVACGSLAFLLSFLLDFLIENDDKVINETP